MYLEDVEELLTHLSLMAMDQLEFVERCLNVLLLALHPPCASLIVASKSHYLPKNYIQINLSLYWRKNTSTCCEENPAV